METLTAAVQTDRHALCAYMNVDIELRIGDLDVRTFACTFLPIISDRILDAIGNKTTVTEGLAIDRSIDSEGGVLRHVQRPVDRLDQLVQPILGFEFGSTILEFQLPLGNGHQHTARCPQTEISTIEQRFVALKRHCPTLYLYIISTQLNQLLSEHLFQAFEGLGKHRIAFHGAKLLLFSDIRKKKHKNICIYRKKAVPLCPICKGVP